MHTDQGSNNDKNNNNNYNNVCCTRITEPRSFTPLFFPQKLVAQIQTTRSNYPNCAPSKSSIMQRRLKAPCDNDRRRKIV